VIEAACWNTNKETMGVYSRGPVVKYNRNDIETQTWA